MRDRKVQCTCTCSTQFTCVSFSLPLSHFPLFLLLISLSLSLLPTIFLPLSIFNLSLSLSSLYLPSSPLSISIFPSLPPAISLPRSSSIVQLNVRKETIQSLCRVYRHVMDKLVICYKHIQPIIIVLLFIRDTLSQSDKDKIDWIPNKLLHCLFQKIREDKLVPLSPSISFSLLSIFPSISLPLSLTPFYLPLPLSSSLSHSFLSSPPSLFLSLSLLSIFPSISLHSLYLCFSISLPLSHSLFLSLSFLFKQYSCNQRFTKLYHTSIIKTRC